MKELIDLLNLLLKKCHEFKSQIESTDAANHFTQLLATQASEKQPYLNRVLDNLSVVLSQQHKLTYKAFIEHGSQLIINLVKFDNNKKTLEDNHEKMAERVVQEVGNKYQNIFNTAHLKDYIDINIDLRHLTQLTDSSRQRNQHLDEIIAVINDVLIFQKVKTAFVSELKSIAVIERTIHSEQKEIKKAISHLMERLNDKHIWEDIVKNIAVQKDVSLKIWQETRDHLGVSDPSNGLYHDVLNLFSDFGFEQALTPCFFDKKTIMQVFDDYNEIVGILAKLKQTVKKLSDEFDLDKIAEAQQEALEKEFHIVTFLRETYQPVKEKFERVLEGGFKGIDEILSSLEDAMSQNILQLKEKINVIQDKLKDICALKDKRNAIDCAIQKFSFKQYGGVQGDFFDYMKQVHFNIGDSAALLKKLNAHGKNHRYKDSEINHFIRSLHQSRNLAEWRQCYDDAINNKLLMQSTTPWGKKLDDKFDIKSTTADLVQALHEQFNAFLEQEHQARKVEISMQQHEDGRVASYFKTRKGDSCLDLVNELCEQLSPYWELGELDGFKESLFHIAMWDTKDAGARHARLAASIHEMHQDIVNKIVKGRLDLNKVKKVLYDFTEQHALNVNDLQKYYPFCYRYEILRRQLSQVKTRRSCQSLWDELDNLAKADDVDEYHRMKMMGKALESFYCDIRQSNFGSVNFFGNGSRLGDAIETFLRNKKGFYLNESKIPHRMEATSSIFKCAGF